MSAQTDLDCGNLRAVPDLGGLTFEKLSQQRHSACSLGASLLGITGEIGMLSSYFCLTAKTEPRILWQLLLKCLGAIRNLGFEAPKLLFENLGRRNVEFRVLADYLNFTQTSTARKIFSATSLLGLACEYQFVDAFETEQGRNREIATSLFSICLISVQLLQECEVGRA